MSSSRIILLEKKLDGAKGVPAPPLLKSPCPSPCLAPLFKIFVSSLLLSIPPTFKIFQAVPSTLMQSLSCPNPIYQPSLHIINMGLNNYQKADFTSSPVVISQKSIFNYLNPFINVSGYLNLWDTFRFSFRQLRMTFFIKLW